MSDFALANEKAFSLGAKKKCFLVRYPSSFDIRKLDGLEISELSTIVPSKKRTVLDLGDHAMTVVDAPCHSIFDPRFGRLKNAEGMLSVGMKPRSVPREEGAAILAENAGLPRGSAIEQPAIIKRILGASVGGTHSVPSSPEEPVKKKKKNK